MASRMEGNTSWLRQARLRIFGSLLELAPFILYIFSGWEQQNTAFVRLRIKNESRSNPQIKPKIRYAFEIE